jgi:hypothetical protein
MSHFRCSENVGSMIPVLAKGKRLDEAIKIAEQDVIDSLDGEDNV